MTEDIRPSDWDRLGVRPGASNDEIKSGFRAQAKTIHPDSGGSGNVNIDDLRESKDRLLGLSEGERRLARYTPAARKKYDEWNQFMDRFEESQTVDSVRLTEEQWRFITAVCEARSMPGPVKLEAAPYRISTTEVGELSVERQITDWSASWDTEIKDYGDKVPGGRNQPVKTTKVDAYVDVLELHRQGESGHMNIRVPQGFTSQTSGLIVVAESMVNPSKHSKEEVDKRLRYVHAENLYRQKVNGEDIKIERTFPRAKMNDGTAYYRGRAKKI